MTDMTKEEMLTLAAKAIGFEEVRLSTLYGARVTGNGHGARPWNPLESIADCGEMECALGINTRWHDDEAYSDISGDMVGHIADYKDHPTKQHARMYASTTVAAMIGAQL